MPDQFNLKRFLDAQKSVYPTALAEVQKGRKQSHWMWFIFPQVKGLGASEMSRYYGIESLEEAEAYLQHPSLGANLMAICKALLTLEENDARKIFGFPDDLKLRSSLTLFAQTPSADQIFTQLLEKFFQGKPDEKTLQILERTV